jgi:hypothetical protein
MAFILAFLLTLTILTVVLTPLFVGGVAALVVGGVKGKAKAREVGVRAGLIALLVVSTLLGAAWLLVGLFVSFVNLF